jgi:hypothetical protein
MADINARTRHLVGTTADWLANGLILGDGEIAIERGAQTRMKVGNGSTAYGGLPFITPPFVASSVGTADAGKIVALAPSGRIHPSMVTVTTGGYKGIADATAPVPAGTFIPGDYFVNTTAGAVHTSWGMPGGTVASVGAQLIWNGVTWQAVEGSESDLSNTADPAKGDALIGVKQPYSTARSRTQHDKNLEEASFLDVCVGDGSDELAKMQELVDYWATRGGAYIKVPAGFTFGVSNTLFVKSNIHLWGLGKIKAVVAFAGAAVQFGYTTAIITAPDTNLCTEASITGVEVDGSNLVTAKNWDPGDLVPAGLDSGLVYVWRNCTDIDIINCNIHSCECDGIGVEDGADRVQIVGNEVHHLVINSEATRFINVINLDGCEDGAVDNNHIHDLSFGLLSPPSWGYGIRLHATDSMSCRGNRITTGYHNILCDGRKNLIEKNNLSGSLASGIVLYYNAFKCLYNVVLDNFINANIRSIYEDDVGNVGSVGWNLIIGNTAFNSDFDIVTEGQGTAVIGNNIYSDAGVTLYPRQTILGASDGNTIGDICSGSWTPIVTNSTNVTTSAASVCRFSRVGSLVHVMGTVTFTPTATGAYEMRLNLPIATTFAADFDAAGRHGDSFSVDGVIQALAAGSTLRLVGTAASVGSKSARFVGTYHIQ